MALSTYGRILRTIRARSTPGSDLIWTALIADISAKAVVVNGAVVGNVTASEVVEIEATGSVTGDIKAPRLAIADGGYFHGRVEMSLLESHPLAERREQG